MNPPKVHSKVPWIIGTVLCLLFALVAAQAEAAVPSVFNTALRVASCALFLAGAGLCFLSIPSIGALLTRLLGAAPNRRAMKPLALISAFIGFYALGHIPLPPEQAVPTKPQLVTAKPKAAAPTITALTNSKELGHWIMPFEPPSSQFLTIREKDDGSYAMVTRWKGGGEEMIVPIRETRSSQGRRFWVNKEGEKTNYTILKDGTLDIRDVFGEYVIAQPFYGNPNSQKEVEDAMDALWAEVSCRKEADCWGGRYRTMALELCIPMIEHQARYDYRWTNGLIEPKFLPDSRWHGKDGRQRGLVDYMGDKIMLQNEFGAYQNYIYVCTFDIQKEDIVDLHLGPGRLDD